ncbi:MAG: ATP synthase F1 subunit epsilon [Oscillospiraceae bacterium]
MKNFHLQIVTPDGLFYDGDAQKVIVRSTTGDVCILANHTDYVTPLGMGEARVTIDDKVRKAACIGGMISVIKGEVSLVPSTFEWAEDIDVNRAERSKEEAEKKIANAENRHQQAALEAKLKRALIRLEVAGK